MTQSMTTARTIRAAHGYRRWGLLAAAFATASLFNPASAGAFPQPTAVEGSLGRDISGIWLSVQQVMPEFRIRYDKEEAGEALPFEVEALTAEEAAAMGEKAGVRISAITDGGRAAEFGLFVGDIIMQIGQNPITDVAVFEKTVAGLGTVALIRVRRGGLRMTTARLFKIGYGAEEATDDGVSTVAVERSQVELLDVQFPFQPRLDASRTKNEFWHPTADELTAIGESWHTYPPASRPMFGQGTHRLVAADVYDASLQDDQALDGTILAMVSDFTGHPASGGGKNVSIYGVREIDDSALAGTYVEAALGSAPFPISIEFKGSFRWFKVAPYSNLDIKHRLTESAPAEEEEDLENVELAPDIPADD